jgi:hypothetical protein
MPITTSTSLRNLYVNKIGKGRRPKKVISKKGKPVIKKK